MNITKKTIIFVLIVFQCFTVCSCDKLSSAFGISNKFDEESVINTLQTDGEIAKKLSDELQMLSVASPLLPTFSNAVEAMKSCRDSVLYRMLKLNYAKYTGDIEKLDEAAQAYPRMEITNIIPAREFEETVYTHFGGNRKISNKSDRLFIYLEDINSYTAVTMLKCDEFSTEVLSLTETENTYRMNVVCSLGEVVSPEYYIVFVKRDDGSVYFKSVKEASEK